MNSGVSQSLINDTEFFLDLAGRSGELQDLADSLLACDDRYLFEAADQRVKRSTLQSAFHTELVVVGELDRELVRAGHLSAAHELSVQLGYVIRRCDRHVDLTLERRPAPIRTDQAS